jgi:hypothetical protein
LCLALQRTIVSDDYPERPPTAQFLAALEVTRNAKIGLASGVLFSTVLFLFFVVLPSDTSESPALYLGLAFVVAVTSAGTVALALTVRSAVRLARDLDGDDESYGDEWN